MSLTLEQAAEQGFKELYFTWAGIGDNIALLFAADMHYALTGRKLLVSPNIHDFFLGCDFLETIEGFAFPEMEVEQTLHEKLPLLDCHGITPYFIAVTDCRDLPHLPGKKAALWPKTHFLAKYCERVGLSGEIDIAPRLVLSEEERRFGRFFDNSQICVMSDGLLKYKTWPTEKMQRLVDILAGKYNFVQIGGKNDTPLRNAMDCRGKFALRQTACVLHNSDLFVGNIGGLMHLARAAGCPAVIAFSAAETLAFDSFSCNANVFPRGGCNICGVNQRDPYLQDCFNRYSCIRNIRVEDMALAVEEKMTNPAPALAAQKATLHADKAHGIDDLLQINQWARSLTPATRFVRTHSIKFKSLGIFKTYVQDRIKYRVHPR